MGDVQSAVGEFNESDIPCHHYIFRMGGNAGDTESCRDGAFVHNSPLCETSYFRMIDYRNAEHLGIFERDAHQLFVLNRVTVI